MARKTINMKLQKSAIVVGGGETYFDDKYPLAKNEVIVGDLAHINAYSPQGPRANYESVGKHSLENLMFIDKINHKVIDSSKNYSDEKLREIKSSHEKSMKEKQLTVKNELKEKWFFK